MMVLAVDPGVRGCGCALFAPDGVLVRAAYVPGAKVGDRAAAWVPMARAVATWADFVHSPIQLVIELPQVYQGSKQTGDPNDLIDLAAIVGGICAIMQCGPETKIYKPREWKGQAPKEIIHERARKRLSTAELAAMVLPAKSLQHNVLDAVAIGLVYLRRM
jgi:RNase H-fold protein (predicted Holliday junction resolvase)